MIAFEKENMLKNEINRLAKITKVISMVRLFLAIFLIIFVVCLLSLEEYILYGMLSGFSFIVLIIFILLTNRFYKNLNLLKKKEKIYLMHYKRRNLDFSSFIDEGRDYIDKEDYKLLDLDLFGSKSLFQYLNVCKTKLGRDLLAKQLSNPTKMSDEFTKTVDSLSKNEDTLDIEAGLLEFDESAKHVNYDEFNSVLKTKIDFKLKFIIPLIFYALSIVFLILMLTTSFTPYPLMISLLLNAFISKKFLNNSIFEVDAFRYYNLCDAYEYLSNRILNVNIESGYFKEIQEKISSNMNNLKRAKKLYLALSSRKNIIFNIILNVLFIYDFWLILIYNKLLKAIDSLEELFELISYVEVMTSLSIIGIDNEVYCIPSNSENIKGKNIYHPLVLGCVKNSFILSGGVVLTGSNMSGKTTFMRTIGLNQILFNAGGIVCAEEFSSQDLPVFTSLRANDMLSEGISTFYAEILRMKKINEVIVDRKCLILIDEIFKGTNAYERIEASLKVIDKLNQYQVLFIISTHDFELCDAKNILNYHFNEEYKDDKIFFDYIIKDGKSNSTNAIYLLKMANII